MVVKTFAGEAPKHLDGFVPVSDPEKVRVFPRENMRVDGPALHSPEHPCNGHDEAPHDDVHVCGSPAPSAKPARQSHHGRDHAWGWHEVNTSL